IQCMDLKPGGKWNLVMHGADGTNYNNSSLFKEIIPFKKIVYQHVSNPHFVANIQFEEHGEQTKLTWHMLFDTVEQFIAVVKTHKADKGLEQNIEKLEVYPTKNRWQLLRRLYKAT
ncbi:MAG: SRPBCC domain-containing protein, partial [Chitinophagaceae bacterium]|nr:SRPBCC domain-containing protein [Chitinophagaceae bacterium]